MPIPFHTTLITIVRSTLDVAADPYEDPSLYPTPDSKVIAVGIRAVVSVPTANVALSIGPRVVYTSKLTCDPCDLREDDFVTESSGRIWQVLGPTPFGAFAISGMECQLRLVESLAQ